LAVAQPAAPDSTVVRIDAGSVRGVSTGDTISWKGIPYAAPPVGELRFRNPQPVNAWQGIKGTTQFAAACMQTDVQRRSTRETFASTNLAGRHRSRAATYRRRTATTCCCSWVVDEGLDC
jgi:hypothetical protein